MVAWISTWHVESPPLWASKAGKVAKARSRLRAQLLAPRLRSVAGVLAWHDSSVKFSLLCFVALHLARILLLVMHGFVRRVLLRSAWPRTWEGRTWKIVECLKMRCEPGQKRRKDLEWRVHKSLCSTSWGGSSSGEMQSRLDVLVEGPRREDASRDFEAGSRRDGEKRTRPKEPAHSRKLLVK